MSSRAAGLRVPVPVLAPVIAPVIIVACARGAYTAHSAVLDVALMLVLVPGAMDVAEACGAAKKLARVREADRSGVAR